MFNLKIYNNLFLSIIEKFNFLAAFLTGELLSIVNCAPMIGAIYQISYDALVKRYDNKRLLAIHYWNQNEDAFSPSDNYIFLLILMFLTTFDENLAALKRCSFQWTQWDYILFNQVYSV